MAVIRKIEAKIPEAAFTNDGKTRKKRVAAYARVSTEQDEQQSSYEAQVNFYTNYIQSNPDWEFAGIYSDEGISGTNIKHRDGFNRMIKDALSGKIDLILTKSISRFARNTVDSLVTIRKLKEKGIEVYFEKENIYTLDSKGELMLTIMSSIAQEESRSISENVTWGKRKSMADGKVYVARKGFLGYKLDENGNTVIDEAEAKIVREIYDLFLKGNTIRNICSILDSRGIPTPRKSKHWPVSTVKSILSNEKYKGDALLQKSYAIDFLNKKRRKNTGELPQYYVEGSHPAIISPELFNLAQTELQIREHNKARSTSIFSSKIICGDCGCCYGRKVKNSTGKNKAHYWYCNKKYSGSQTCETPSITEEAIKDAFVRGFNSLIANKKYYFSKITSRLESLDNTQNIQAELEDITKQYNELTQQLRQLIEQNSVISQDQEEYRANFESLNSRRLQLEDEIGILEKQLQSIRSQKEQIALFLKTLEKEDRIIQSFDEELWNILVKNMTIMPNQTVVLLFKDGTKMTVEL